jgi:antitoxin component YwqK of YwqJK toxin-antitoxin module
MNHNAFTFVNMITIKNIEAPPEPIKEEIHEYESEKNKNGLYDCTICCEEYTKDNIKFPCKISKNHTICNTCFEEWKNNCCKQFKEVTCPVCRNILPKNGKYIHYYENGVRRQEVEYINDIPHGLVQIWDLNGILKLKFYTQNYNYHGLHEEYDDEGFLKKRAHYQNNILDGLFEEYYPYEILKVQCTYKNGLINGIYKLFYNTSLLFLECQCGPIGGKINGYLHVYNEDGILVEKYNCKNSRIDIKFDEDLNVSYSKKSGNFTPVEL